jgi:hypothetical protein
LVGYTGIALASSGVSTATQGRSEKRHKASPKLLDWTAEGEATATVKPTRPATGQHHHQQQPQMPSSRVRVDWACDPCPHWLICFALLGDCDNSVLQKLTLGTG